MARIKDETFVCIDCETTGLDSSKDRIIEVAIVKFTEDAILEQYESLVDPQCPIPEETTKIHNITNQMVFGKPLITQVLLFTIRTEINRRKKGDSFSRSANPFSTL